MLNTEMAKCKCLGSYMFQVPLYKMYKHYTEVPPINSNNNYDNIAK